MLCTNKHVAVVGCGYWGKNLVRNFAELGVLRVICDSSQPTLEELKEKFGVEGISDFEKVLAMPDVQAVVVATPAPTHATLVIQALAAGKDVFVEKPLALTLEDALAIQAAARKSDCILMVGHLLEYHPALVKLRNLVAEGKIGKLQYLVTVQGGRESRLKKAAGSGGRRFRTLGDSDPQCTGARSQEELKR